MEPFQAAIGTVAAGVAHELADLVAPHHETAPAASRAQALSALASCGNEVLAEPFQIAAVLDAIERARG